MLVFGSRKFVVQQHNQKEVERLTTDLQNDIIENTKKQLVVDDINFTGGLSKSVVPGEFNGFKTVEIQSPYGVPVEFGMPPGIHVNFDALRKWVEGKLGVDPSESKDVTFKIWRKILNEGIKPTRFFKKAIKRTIGQRGIISTGSGKRGYSRKRNSFSKKFLNKIKKYINIALKAKRFLRRQGRIKASPKWF